MKKPRYAVVVMVEGRRIWRHATCAPVAGEIYARHPAIGNEDGKAEHRWPMTH